MNNEVIQFLEESQQKSGEMIQLLHTLYGIVILLLLGADLLGIGYLMCVFVWSQKNDNTVLSIFLPFLFIVILLLLLAWGYKTYMDERRKLLKMAIEWEKFCVEKRMKCADNGYALLKTVVPVGFSPSPSPVEVSVKVEGIW